MSSLSTASSEEEMNNLFNENLSQTKLQQIVTKTKKLVKKTKGFLETIFFEPHSYALSFVNLLITTYDSFTEVAFKYISCIPVGDKFYVISDTEMVCGSSEWLSW